VAATTLILSFPLTTTLNNLNVPGFENHYVSAATLAEVNLLQSTNVTATANDTNDFALEVSGQSLANLELLGPERVAVFKLDLSGLSQEVQDQIEIVASDANVSVDLTAVTMDDLPVLNNAIGGITSTATGLVEDVLKVVDDLQKSIIPDRLLTIEGISELEQALAALNNLDQAISDVLQYNASLATTVGPNGELIVDFSDGLGQHLETAVNEVVIETLENLVGALNGVRLAILPGEENIPGVGLIIGGLNSTINGVLGGVTSLVGEVTGVLDQLTDGVLDLSTDLAHVQALGNFTVSIPSVKVNNANSCTIGDVGEQGAQVKGAIVSTNAIDLTLLSSLDASDDITVTVEEGEECSLLAEQHNPGYDSLAILPGETEVLEQTGDTDLPEETTFEITDGSDFPEGWEVEIDPDTGTVTVTAPEDANPGDTIDIPVTITYPDGSEDETIISVTVDVDDSDADADADADA